MVHLVQLNTLIEYMQLLCSEHLPFPVGIALDLTEKMKNQNDMRKDTTLKNSNEENPEETHTSAL